MDLGVLSLGAVLVPNPDLGSALLSVEPRSRGARIGALSPTAQHLGTGDGLLRRELFPARLSQRCQFRPGSGP